MARINLDQDRGKSHTQEVKVILKIRLDIPSNEKGGGLSTSKATAQWYPLVTASELVILF